MRSTLYLQLGIHDLPRMVTGGLLIEQPLGELVLWPLIARGSGDGGK